MDWLLQPETWIAFVTLVVLELVLGVDNVIFISILAGKLPHEHLDSVITAVGMVNELSIMIGAVVIAAVVMVFTSTPLAEFVERHPTIKMLALSFLLLIGFTLIVEGLHQHIPKGYIYFAMGFSVFVEMLNLRLRQPSVKPVNLRDAYKQTKLVPEGAPSLAELPSKPSSSNGKSRKKKK